MGPTQTIRIENSNVQVCIAPTLDLCFIVHVRSKNSNIWRPKPWNDIIVWLFITNWDVIRFTSNLNVQRSSFICDLFLFNIIYFSLNITLEPTRYLPRYHWLSKFLHGLTYSSMLNTGRLFISSISSKVFTIFFLVINIFGREFVLILFSLFSLFPLLYLLYFILFDLFFFFDEWDLVGDTS